MYLRFISPCLVFDRIKCLILTHINGASSYPAPHMGQVDAGGMVSHIISYMRYVWKWYNLECVHAMIICENNAVFAKSDFWSKIRQPAPVSPIPVVSIQRRVAAHSTVTVADRIRHCYRRRWSNQQPNRRRSAFVIVYECFSRLQIMLGRTETPPRDRMYCQTIRTS